MDPMPAADPVTDLVARLERGVVASRRRRRETVAEVEGDLREAVAARVERGEAGPEAARAVVAEFGDPSAIAAELSHELLADLGRRYSPASAAGAGLLVVAWIAGMTTLAGMPGFRVPTDVAWMLPLSRALDVLAPVVVVAAAVGWLAIRRAGSIAALVAVAALQLALAAVLVAGAVAMAVSLPVPAGGEGVLAALVLLTVLVGSAIAAGAAALLLRSAGVRLAGLRRAPRRARA